MTKYEPNPKAIDERARQIVAREIKHDLSALIYRALETGGGSSEWMTDDERQSLQYRPVDWVEAMRQHGWHYVVLDGTHWSVPTETYALYLEAVARGASDDEIGDLLEACDDALATYDIGQLGIDWEATYAPPNFDRYPYQAEVYEHWLVSDWLAHQLRVRGHSVTEWQDLTVWGRSDTGQAIYCDCVIQELARAALVAEHEQEAARTAAE